MKVFAGYGQERAQMKTATSIGAGRGERCIAQMFISP